MRNMRVRVIAEIGLSVALFALLDFFNPVRMAFGGSVALVMLPIVVLALLRGPVAGIIAGALCGLVDLAYQPYILNTAQVILDYPLAYAFVGLAGVFSPLVRRSGNTKDSNAAVISGFAVAATALGALGRFVAAVLSGVIFFAENAPAGQNIWLYSAAYNLSYLLPSAVGVAICAALVSPLLVRQFTEKS